MILFKAINYEENCSLEMSSEVKGKYINECIWEEMIVNAFSHISQKNEKNYWISTNKSLKTAIEYMNEPMYNFNGIAVIELPNTIESGRIYDTGLREYGGRLGGDWIPNADGIIVTLDMTSVFTQNYLGTFLCLRQRISPLKNFVEKSYADINDEVLILGEGIKFEFYGKNQQNALEDKYKDKYTENPIIDYLAEITESFIACSPNANQKCNIKNRNEKEIYKFFNNEKYRWFANEDSPYQVDEILSFEEYLEFYFFSDLYINYNSKTIKDAQLANLSDLYNDKFITENLTHKFIEDRLIALGANRNQE